MLMDTQNLALDIDKGNPIRTSANNREQNWLKSRIHRGVQERFVEIVKVTPGLASAMMERNVNNRHLGVNRVSKYASIMQEGRWRLTSEALAFSTAGDLLDGQHRLAAIIESTVSIETTVWFGCRAEEFSVIDQGAARTAADLISIDGLGWAYKRASLAQLLLRIQYPTIRTFDAARVRAKCLDMQSATLDMALRAGDRASKVLNKTAASLAHYEIALKSGKVHRIDEFWDGLCGGAGLATSSPILGVREWLRSNVLAKNSRERGIKEAAAVILAWNAFLKGNRGRKFRWESTTSLPEVL